MITKYKTKIFINFGGIEMKYIKNTENLCHKCLKEKEEIDIFSITNRGYGSRFDSCNYHIQLCKDCQSGIEDELNKWCNEIPADAGCYEEYYYEDNLIEFVNSLPLQGREIIQNQTSCGATYNIDSQDFIDIELGIAPDETYKKYGMYSPSEIEAYHNRFPTCKHTYLKEFPGGSSITKCSKQSFVSGNSDFTCGIHISEECYYCEDYEKKEENFVHNVEKCIQIKPKLVQMYEIFCPTCGHKILKYKHSLEDEDTLYCNKCSQEIVANI